MLRSCCIINALLVVTLVGCGGDGLPPPVPVKGKVTLQGKPVEGAVVSFLSSGGGRSASGRTEKDGTFVLTTAKTGDGAPPGDYVVTISKQEPKKSGTGTETDVASGVYGDDYGAMMAAAATGDMSKVMKNELPAKYAAAGTSGLTRTVVKGDANEFDFDL